MNRTKTTLLLLALSVAPQVRGQLFGVDVSTFQGFVNWTSMKNDDIAFGFAKATEGVDFIDVRFAQNMTNAAAAGVPIGPYHFARPDSFVGTLADPVKIDAVNEANDFVDAIEPYYNANPSAYLRPVLDVERLPSTAEINTVSEQRQYLSDWIHDFADVVVNRLGVEPIIYLNANYANNYILPSVAQYDLWLARWTYNVNNQPTQANLGPWDDWEFWQWSDSWSAGGESPVDGNYFLGDEADLGTFLYAYEPLPALAGDYNDDGSVDAADYAFWREVSPADDPYRINPANGNGDDVVDDIDFFFWYSKYGSTASAVSVPEPGSLVLAALAMFTARRRAIR